MTLSDIQTNPSPKTLRQFSAAWLVFLLAAGAHQYLKRGHAHAGILLMLLALVVGIVGLILPTTVRWLFVAATMLAFPIGWVVTQLMLLVMFYLILTPVAFVFRLMGRDALCRKPPKARSSFWIPKQTPQDVNSYFRQY